MEYVLKRLIIAVRNGPSEIREYYVTPGTEGSLIVRLRDRGWTAFAHGRVLRMQVQALTERN
jgi:hypothetical protein